MASKRIIVTNDEFVKINDGNAVISQVLNGRVFFCVCGDGDTPLEENSFILKDNFVYGGTDDVYAKARDKRTPATLIVDS